MTVVSCRAKDHPLSPPSNLFRPRRSPPKMKGSGGGAGYRPRVRKTYSDVHLSPYPPCDGAADIRHATGKGKVFRRPGRGFPACLSFLRMRVRRSRRLPRQAGERRGRPPRSARPAGARFYRPPTRVRRRISRSFGSPPIAWERPGSRENRGKARRSANRRAPRWPAERITLGSGRAVVRAGRRRPWSRCNAPSLPCPFRGPSRIVCSRRTATPGRRSYAC